MASTPLPTWIALTPLPTAIASTPLPTWIARTPLPTWIALTPLPTAIASTPLPTLIARVDDVDFSAIACEVVTLSAMASAMPQVILIVLLLSFALAAHSVCLHAQSERLPSHHLGSLFALFFVHRGVVVVQQLVYTDTPINTPNPLSRRSYCWCIWHVV